MKPFWIMVICIFAYSDYPYDDGFVDYAADFDSSVLAAFPQDPPNYMVDEHATELAVANASQEDPGLAGGTTEPTAEVDPSTVAKAKTNEDEEIDYYKECTDKGYAPEQCCKTCVESFLSGWAESSDVHAEDIAAQQQKQAEDAVIEGSRGPASEGVGVGN